SMALTSFYLPREDLIPDIKFMKEQCSLYAAIVCFRFDLTDHVDYLDGDRYHGTAKTSVITSGVLKSFCWTLSSNEVGIYSLQSQRVYYNLTLKPVKTAICGYFRRKKENVGF